MLDCNGTNVALRVDIKNRAVIEVSGFGNLSVAKLNEQGICIGKAANFHGTNLRSKKALWTACPSANRITGNMRLSSRVAVRITRLPSNFASARVQ
jgi:hypothetical protein